MSNKEAVKKYQQSDKGKATLKRWQQSDHGKMVSKVIRTRYRQSDKYRRTRKNWLQSNRGKVISKAAEILYLYGITMEEYNKLVEKQEGKCAICGKVKSTLCVDHDYKTKKVRGMLCSKCNLLLGHAGDRISILSSAINYLKGNIVE